MVDFLFQKEIRKLPKEDMIIQAYQMVHDKIVHTKGGNFPFIPHTLFMNVFSTDAIDLELEDSNIWIKKRSYKTSIKVDLMY